MNGDNDVAFAGGDWEHPSLLARLKSYWDLTPDSYLEVGLNGLHGNADADGRLDHDFFALDLTYNWYPAGRELYREFTLRGMLLYSDLALDAGSARERMGRLRLRPDEAVIALDHRVCATTASRTSARRAIASGACRRI